MRKKLAVLMVIGLAGVALLLLARPNARAVPNPVMNTKWEYKVMEFTEVMDVWKALGLKADSDLQALPDALNKIAQDGWELVAVQTRRNSREWYYFKRPLKAS